MLLNFPGTAGAFPVMPVLFSFPNLMSLIEVDIIELTGFSAQSEIFSILLITEYNDESLRVGFNPFYIPDGQFNI